MSEAEIIQHPSSDYIRKLEAENARLKEENAKIRRLTVIRSRSDSLMQEEGESDEEFMVALKIQAKERFMATVEAAFERLVDQQAYVGWVVDGETDAAEYQLFYEMEVLSLPHRHQQFLGAIMFR